MSVSRACWRVAIACAVAGCGSDGGTAIVPPPPPAPPQVAPPFPALTRAGSAYLRTTASSFPGTSRVVLYDDGSFALQYSRADYGLLEYPGRYSRTDSTLALQFSGDARWSATAILRGDTLRVAFGVIMQGSDFEDGSYVISALGPGAAGSHLAVPVRAIADAGVRAVSLGPLGSHALAGRWERRRGDDAASVLMAGARDRTHKRPANQAQA